MNTTENETNGVTQEQLQDDARRRAVAVRLRVVGQPAIYDAKSFEVQAGDNVLVKTEAGTEIGTILGEPPSSFQAEGELAPIEGRFEEKDEETQKQIRAQESEAFDFCSKEIKKSELGMKLISTHITHDGSHATFYFTAGQRVDFRALVKMLAQRFQMRIAMRQIGVRDAARHTGGTGICGRELCCSTWIPEFKPISIRMAKDQNLTLNNLKLSGLCGRLRCCLEYEYDLYKKARKGLPKLNKRVITPKGEGRTRDINVLRRTIRVQLSDGTMEEFPAEEITRVDPQQAQEKQPKNKSALAQSKSEKPQEARPGPDENKPPKDEAGSSQPKRKKRRRKRKKSNKTPDKNASGSNKGSTPPKNSDKNRDS